MKADNRLAEAFHDYIGEISLVKDFTSTMDAVMTDEEKAEMEAAKAAGESAAAAEDAAATPVAGASASASVPASGDDKASDHSVPASSGASFATGTTAATAGPGPAKADDASSTTSGHLNKHDPNVAAANAAKAESDKKGKQKLSPEQKAKLEELDNKKEEERKKRIDELTQKLIQRIRPFVEAKHPGDANDPETKAFEQKVAVEAEDLKLESFGVEILHTISGVYITRAGNFVKSKKFFGGGFIGRLKEKGGMVKEGWGLLGSAIGVQSAMQEMERLEAKGTATPDEIAALAEELSGKMLLTTWRATRWEILNILGPVVDNVLYEPGISKDTALRRAKAILTIGGIFKNVQPDEGDDERRELERLVQEAANKKKKTKKVSPKGTPAPPSPAPVEA